MSTPTRYIITVAEVNEQIATLEAERDAFLEKANLQVVSFNSQIEALRRLTALPLREPEAAPAAEVEE